jgi:putrescine transport system substrate-binding protein
MSINIRAGLVGLVAATALVGCGKKAEQPTPAAENAQAPAAASVPASTEEKVVNVYNWSDYVDPKTLEQFTKETGIKVNYDVFDNNEVLETKLLAGSTGYDVVVPGASFLERQIKAGVFRKLDKSKLPNWQNLDPAILKRLQLHDPGNEHAVNHMWGTTGIGYNVKKVQAVDPKAPVDSWNLVLDPKWAAKFKDCGISVLDAPDEIVGVVLAYLGKDPNSEKPEDLKAAEDVLMKVRPYIRMIHSSTYIDSLANGDLCVSVGWSGDVLQARDRAVEAGQGVEIAYNVPKEGTIIWFDNYAIPADAPHPDNAHAFINFMMKPEVAAANSNFVHYANGNAASVPLLDPAVRDNPGVYPPPEVMAKLFPNLARSAEYTRLLNRTWTRFTTGK